MRVINLLLVLGCGQQAPVAPLPAQPTLHPPVSELCTTVYGPCALLRDGRLACWARGAPFTLEAAGIQGTLSCGRYHACIEDVAGNARCLSFDGEYQAELSLPPELEPPLVAWWLNPYWMAGGCGIQEDLGLVCGGGADSMRIEGAQAVTVGFGGPCQFSLDPDGEIHGWMVGGVCGGEEDWQEGIDVYGLDEIPSGLWVSVEGGMEHACALDAGGRPTCWGNYGFLGAPPEDDRFTEVSVGDDTTCGITTEGYLRCWADQRLIDHEASAEKTSWVLNKVPTTGGWVHVVVSNNEAYACAVDVDGQVDCFGNVLPDGTLAAALANPVDTQPPSEDY